jgi:gas vesicle protein
MRGLWAGVVLALLAAPAAGSEFRYSVRLSSVQARDLARGMERELEELSRKEAVERERYVQAAAAIGAIMASFGKWAPGDQKAGAAVSELMGEFQRISEEHRKVADPLVLRIALRAHQLQKYKETGSLALEEGEIEDIREALLHPRTAIPPSKPLPLDIVELRKYLDDWWKPAKDRGRKETLPPAQALPRRPALEPSAPALARDAGRGRLEIDPVPALLEQLASPDPRQRALAADALGTRGEQGARLAVPALRQALHDEDGRVRASAVLSLAAVAGRDPDVIEELRQALADRDADVRFSAHAALRQLGRLR